MRLPECFFITKIMKKVFVLIIFIAYLGSCQLVEGDTSEHLIAPSDSSDVNPNGSSELSILMRQMYDHAQAARVLALQEKKNSEFPTGFNKIHTATPTDHATKNEHYDTFADVYLNAVKSYSTTTSLDLKSNYNNMVNTCLACHATHCPGPISKIKKLLIP